MIKIALTPRIIPDGYVAPINNRPDINPRPRHRAAVIPAPVANPTPAAPVTPADVSAVSSEESRRNYDVGYAKPPKRTRFKKGQSGNPKGRPKGAKSFRTIARRLLTEKISIRTARGQTRVTRIEAMMMKLIETASKGDFRALQSMFALYQQVMPDEPLDFPAADTALSAADEATLALFAAAILEGGEALQ